MAESGFVDVNGGQLYYEADGDGPPLTLIHAGVAHLRMWDAQVAAWRDRFRVIRYDTRGFGRTRTDDVPYSNRDDLGRLLDALGVDSTHLLGASRGSIIATDFTLERPDRVRSLVWVAGGLRGHAVDDQRLADIWPELERLEEARDWPALVELDTMLWTDGPGQGPDRVDPAIRRQMVEWNMENYLADQHAAQVIPTDWRTADRIGEIKVPTLLIWGRLDELGVTTAGERLAREIRGARVHVFDDVAHMVNLERPHEFNRVVAAFLAEVVASNG
jgi:3-oxoadipate enol-lactonase